MKQNLARPRLCKAAADVSVAKRMLRTWESFFSLVHRSPTVLGAIRTTTPSFLRGPEKAGRNCENEAPGASGPEPAATPLKRPLSTRGVGGIGGVGAHAGAGHGCAKRCWAGREVVAAAAGTAEAVVLSDRPSEKWETRGRR